MAAYRITLTVQEIDVSKPAGADNAGDPIELEVGLVAAPNYERAKQIIGEMLQDTAYEFQHAGEESDDV